MLAHTNVKPKEHISTSRKSHEWLGIYNNTKLFAVQSIYLFSDLMHTRIRVFDTGVHLAV